MFGLFRKRQKLILTTIATLAIGSMAFSAIAPLFLEDKGGFQTEAKNLIKSYDEGMRKLVSSSFDASPTSLIFPTNLFSEAIVSSGILEEVYTFHEDKYQNSLKHVFEKINHASDLKVSDKMTLQEAIVPVLPNLHEAILNVKKMASRPFSAQHVAALKTLFIEKSHVPMPFLYRYLENLNQGKMDFSEEELAFFGLKNPEDFFGEELYQDAISCFTKTFETRIEKGQKTQVNGELAQVLERFYQQKIFPAQFFIALGIDPEIGLNLFLMKKAQETLFFQNSQKVLLDGLSYSEVENFSSQGLVCNVTALKKEYFVQSFEEAVFQEIFFNSKEPISAEKYEVQLRVLDKDKSIKKIPKKQLYQVALESYDELCGNYPYIFSKDTTEESQRLESIKKACVKNLSLLEKHVQKKIYQKDPQSFVADLQTQNFETKELIFTEDMQISPLKGFATAKQLKDELNLIPDATPVCFDVSDSMLYEIRLLKKGEKILNLNFQNALNSGILKDKVKRILEVSYKEMARKSPQLFLNASKKLKTLDEAYEDVLALHFKDLKKNLENLSLMKGDISSSLLIKNYPRYVLNQLLDGKISKQDERLEKTIRVFERKQSVAKKVFEAKSDRLIVIDENGHPILVEKTAEKTEGDKVLSKHVLQTLQEEAFKSDLKKILVL